MRLPNCYYLLYKETLHTATAPCERKKAEAFLEVNISVSEVSKQLINGEHMVRTPHTVLANALIFFRRI